MDYYEKKKRAFMDIDTEIKANNEANLPTNIKTISFKITKRYGFGKKITADYIKNLVDLNIIRLDKTKENILSTESEGLE